MTNPLRRRSRGLTIAVLIVAVVIVAGTIIVIVSASRGGQMSTSAPAPSAQPETVAPADPSTDAEEGTMQPSPSPSPFTGAVLPQSMGGQEAIDALGDKIEVVAKRNGKTVEELEDLLLRDKTAQVSTTGFILYVDTFKNED